MINVSEITLKRFGWTTILPLWGLLTVFKPKELNRGIVDETMHLLLASGVDVNSASSSLCNLPLKVLLSLYCASVSLFMLALNLFTGVVASLSSFNYSLYMVLLGVNALILLGCYVVAFITVVKFRDLLRHVAAGQPLERVLYKVFKID